jgi:hypothetical protein
LDSNRYGVLAVTVLAVLVAAIAAALTRNSWADKTNSKSSLSVRLQQTTTTFGSPSTTTVSVSTTVALPVPTTARSTVTTRASTATTAGGTATTATTRGTTPTSSTTSTTKGPSGSFDQRSDNDASFPYTPGGGGAGSQGPTSSKGALAFIVKGQAETSSWHLTTDVRNNSGRDVRFDGGIDTVVHLLCNGKSSDQHLANPNVTTMPAGGGVILQADITPIDSGSGTCTLYGTVRYSTV